MIIDTPIVSFIPRGWGSMQLCVYINIDIHTSIHTFTFDKPHWREEDLDGIPSSRHRTLRLSNRHVQGFHWNLDPKVGGRILLAHQMVSRWHANDISKPLTARQMGGGVIALCAFCFSFSSPFFILTNQSNLKCFVTSKVRL